MTRKWRLWAAGAAIGVAGLGAGVGIGLAWPAPAAPVVHHAQLLPVVKPASELPPECVVSPVVDNSGAGPTLWVKWCGTGSGGESPMDAGKAGTVVDGSSLTPRNCTRLAPCIVVWPGSPPS